MIWEKFFRGSPKKIPIWAALCIARSDGSNPEYPAQAKHAVLVMVRSAKSEAERAIYSLLQSNGWRGPAIQNLKLLNDPFHSDDPIMRACHEGAIKRDGGIVVYADPIQEEVPWNSA
jgi:hypothetical protein